MTAIEAANKRWEQRFHEMISYEKKNGHLFLFRRSHPHERALGTWVGRQRNLHRKNLLQQDRVDKLNSVDFPWIAETYQDRKWRKVYTQLVEQFECNGYVDFNQVPNLWAKTQRRLYHEGKLNQEKIDLLEKINFIWHVPLARKAASDDQYSIDLGEKKWKARFEQLIEHKKIFGHCVVDKSYDPKLSEWVSYQRFFHRRGKLLKSKVEMLDTICFEWHLEKSRKCSHDNPNQSKRSCCLTRSSHSGNDVKMNKNDSKEFLSFLARGCRNRPIQRPANKKNSETTTVSIECKAHRRGRVLAQSRNRSALPLVHASCANNLKSTKRTEPFLPGIVLPTKRSRLSNDEICIDQTNTESSQEISLAYPIGTQLLTFFPNHGWKKGSIQAFNNGSCIVQYQGNENDEYSFDELSVHSFVELARTFPHLVHTGEGEQGTSLEADMSPNAMKRICQDGLSHGPFRYSTNNNDERKQRGCETEVDSTPVHHESLGSQNSVIAERMNVLTKLARCSTFGYIKSQVKINQRGNGKQICKLEDINSKSMTVDFNNVELNQFSKDSVGRKVWNVLQQKMR